MRTEDHWPSTKAMSVYHALSVSGSDLTLDQVRSFIHKKWGGNVSADYVREGAEFLLARSIVKSSDGDTLKLLERHPKTRRGRMIVRIENDAELKLLPNHWHS